LDGIDLNFEGIRSLEEWNAYLAFLSAASTHLHRHDLLVTVALHPGQYLPSGVCGDVDRVHVMTYDMIRPSTVDHHASMNIAKDSIEKFAWNGCPPSKLVMGIPAYGRHVHDMGLVMTYSELVDDIMMNGGDEKMEMETAKTTIQSINSWSGYRFDSPDDVRTKVEYAVSNGLGGIFIWELGQDKRMPGLAEGGMLLEVAAAAATNAVDRYAGDVLGDEF
jgi:chitinase